MPIEQPHRDMRLRIGAIGIAVIILALAVTYRIMAAEPSSAATGQGGGAPTASTIASTTAPSLAPNVVSGTSSATEALTQTFLTQYLAATAGGTVPLSNSDALGVAIANSIKVDPPAYRVYTALDITTVTDTPAHKQAYESAVVAAYAPLRSSAKPEITLYTETVNGDAAAKAQLQEVIAAYARANAAAAKVAVPQGALALHLAALNALSRYDASLADLLAHLSDPVASILLMRDYNDAEQGMFDSFGALQHYLATSTTP